MRRERERDTIFLCWLFLHRQLSIQPTRGARSAQIRLASPSSESRLSRSEAGTQLPALSQIPKFSAHASGAWRHSHPLVLISICDFFFYISEWHIISACTWTPALMLQLTNPCAKRKVIRLTKPEGKIYKTKSLSNYITKPKSGIIPSGQLNYSNFEHLNVPGKELNVTDATEKQFL